MNDWLQFRGKGRGVVAHHFSPLCAGRPLYLMIPGGAPAVTAGVWIFVLAKAVWVDHLRSVHAATPQLVVLLVMYFFGLAIFSYAYELYNWRRALGLTLLLGAVGLAIIYVGVAIANVLRCLPKKDSGENSDANSGHISGSGVGGFYVDKPEGAGSGPDGNILSLATCPQCGQPLSAIGAVCPSCIAKATGFTGP
jgi:hypothetical protein